MVCDNCGICCQRGFYKTSEVVKGLIKYNSINIIDYLKSKGINSKLKYKSLYDTLKFYEVNGIDSPKPCIFLNEEKKCVIHPSIIGEEIRGKICAVPACNKP
ncbi:MAG: YkgJ family cysteine cluster protein [Candidatus Nanoarchaeia archaeon]|jgi:Fe-S-cluster containining protein